MFRVPVRSIDGKLVVITGAASGIGRATADAAAREGARLILTDISADALDKTADSIRSAGGKVVVTEAVDVADHESVRAFAKRVHAEFGAVDVVMNIAGIAAWGTISAMPHATWERVIDINLLGPINVLECFVPPMIDAGKPGHIVNCSSAAGIIGLPWHAAYSASKFGLRGVSEVLRFDLEPHHIGVSLVCPGGVDTGLTDTVEVAGVDNASPEFQRARDRFRKHAVTPEAAASEILKGIRRNRYWVYTSLDIRAAHWLQRFFPPGYRLAMRIIHRAAARALPEAARARRVETA